MTGPVTGPVAVPAAPPAKTERAIRIPTYVINLDRRPDRWATMEARLGALGIPHERVAAVDAETADPALFARAFPRAGPLGRLGRGDMACTLSHFETMRRFLATDAARAMVLEDDALLGDDLAHLLRYPGWWPEGLPLVKIEAYLHPRLRLLLGPEIGRTGTGRKLHPLLSRHTGSAGYLIDRAGAEALLAAEGRILVPIDHLLFNPTVSPLARRLRAHQVVPAPVMQTGEAGLSDVAPHRRTVRPEGLAYAWRETVRGLYEIRDAWWQGPWLLTGRARLAHVRFRARG